MHYNAGDDPLPPLPNREYIPPLCRVLLRSPLFKAHPEADDEAETRSLPFLPNRKLFALRDAEIYSQLPSSPAHISDRTQYLDCVLTQ